ncbi:HIT family protein [Thiovibrio sp. JS02]
MHSHAPFAYRCPFCLLAAGVANEHVTSRASDIVYQDEAVLAFICSRQWPNNKGHVLIVPAAHHENIFDLPPELAAKIHAVAREIALAMKTAYGCEGISTRQHNEPAGNQEVWHYHLHLYPRYANDGLYRTEKGEVMAPAERAKYAGLLRGALASPPLSLVENVVGRAERAERAERQ